MTEREFDFLTDSTETTSTRFVCFIDEDTLHRFDLAITTTDRFYGKKLVTDLQSGRTAILGPDDLEADGYLEQSFKLTNEQAAAFRAFLNEVIGVIHYSDF